MVFMTLIFVALLSRRTPCAAPRLRSVRRGRLCRHYGDNLLLTGVAFLNRYLGAARGNTTRAGLRIDRRVSDTRRVEFVRTCPVSTLCPMPTLVTIYIASFVTIVVDTARCFALSSIVHRALRFQRLASYNGGSIIHVFLDVKLTLVSLRFQSM